MEYSDSCGRLGKMTNPKQRAILRHLEMQVTHTRSPMARDLKMVRSGTRELAGWGATAGLRRLLGLGVQVQPLRRARQRDRRR